METPGAKFMRIILSAGTPFIHMLDVETLCSIRATSTYFNSTVRPHMAERLTLCLPFVFDLGRAHDILQSNLAVKWRRFFGNTKHFHMLSPALHSLDSAHLGAVNLAVPLPKNLKKLKCSQLGYDSTHKAPDFLINFTRELDVLIVPEHLTQLEIGDMHLTSLKLPASMTHFIIRGDFDNMLLIPEGLVKLKLSRTFNREIRLPQSLIFLTLGIDFDTEIRLPPRIKRVKFGLSFNKKVDLPESLEVVKFVHWFDQSVHLPQSLVTLDMGQIFNRSVTFPEGLRFLSMGAKFDQPMNLPRNLFSLKLGRQFDRDLFLPANIVELVLGDKFNRHIVLPESLQRIQFGRMFNQPLKKVYPTIPSYFGKTAREHVRLPNSLRHLKLGFNFNLPIELPPRILSVKFEHDFNQRIDLPPGILRVKFGPHFNKQVLLPSSVERVKFHDEFNKKVALPEGLLRASFGFSFCQTLVLPKTLDHLRMSGFVHSPCTLPPKTVSAPNFKTPLHAPRSSVDLVIFAIFPQVVNITPNLKTLRIVGFTDQELTPCLEEPDTSNYLIALVPWKQNSGAIYKSVIDVYFTEDEDSSNKKRKLDEI